MSEKSPNPRAHVVYSRVAQTRIEASEVSEAGSIAAPNPKMGQAIEKAISQAQEVPIEDLSEYEADLERLDLHESDREAHNAMFYTHKRGMAGLHNMGSQKRMRKAGLM